MTSLGTIIGRGVTGSRPAAGTPGALYFDTTRSVMQRDNGSTWDDVEGAGGGGAALALLLDYTYAGSDINGTSLTAATWTDVISNQSFTTTGSAIVQFALRGAITVGNQSAGGNSFAAVRLVIDSAGTPINADMVSSEQYAGSYSIIELGSVLYKSGLSAGSHTVKVQVKSPQSGNALYLRPSGQADYEFLGLQVIQ